MLEFDDLEDGIFCVRLNDPQGRNAIDTAFVEEMAKVSNQLQRDPKAKVVILAGLPDIFSSGGSAALIEELHEFYRDQVEHEYLRKMKAMLDIPLPVIAAMEGGAVGGGLSLGLYADMVIAAEESRYGFSFMNMGFTPGMGTTALALDAFGPALGFEMMCTGDLKKGRDLHGCPGINAVLPRDRVMDHARGLADAMAEKPRVALELCKKYASLRKKQRLEETSLIEAMMHKISFNQDHIREMVDQGFTG